MAEIPPSKTPERDFLRKLLLKMYWDGEEEPSVLAPLGDFFGVGHARTVNFSSAPLQMSPDDGQALGHRDPVRSPSACVDQPAEARARSRRA